MEQDKIAQELEETKEQKPVENEIERAKKRRREVIFEVVLFFVLGVLLGVTIKSEATSRITIGFNDYLITKPLQSYDVAALKKNIDDQIAKQQAEQQVLPGQESAQ